MKKKGFIHNPKLVIVSSLIVALCLGGYGYYRINRAPAYRFATAGPGMLSASSNSSTQTLSLGFLAGGRIKSVNIKALDTVKKGDLLASLDAGNTLGALTQAKAAYATATANYTKIVNGATGPTIDVAKAALHTAQVNLTEGSKQQDTLVENARRTLFNSTLTAVATVDSANNPKAPAVSGTYTGTEQGTITVHAYPTSDGGYFVYSGLVSGTGKMSSSDPQPIGTTGLSLLFTGTYSTDFTWTIAIPNTDAPNYLTNYNAYQQALQTRSQTEASLQAIVDQAQSSLTALVTAARPEDLASAQAQVEASLGAVQIAQAAYDNTIITAPQDGTITAVSIAVGQIAVANAPAISINVEHASGDAAILVPKTALVTLNGTTTFVMKKTGTALTQVQVTVGREDAVQAEILSGLSVGDEVVIH